MQKTELYEAIKHFANIHSIIKSKTAQLDPELPEQIRTRRVGEIKAEYQVHLDALEKKLHAGKQHFQGLRELYSNPRTALFRTALRRAKELTPGHQMVAESFGLLDNESLLVMLPELEHPSLLLRGFAELQARAQDMDAEGRVSFSKQLSAVFDPLAEKHLDNAFIRECAEVEHTINMTMLDVHGVGEGDPVVKIGLARENQQLEPILAKAA